MTTKYICFCECHDNGCSKCPDCQQNHTEPTTPQKIEIVYEGAAAQGEDVRTGPVLGPTREDLIPEDVLLRVAERDSNRG